MNLLKGDIRKIYVSYLKAAFGSAMISAIYGIVDMAMVGQYQGPEGTAALAVVAPVWNIIYSLGLLMGIGGSVLFSIARGKEGEKNSNQYFTAALLGTIILSLLSWGGLLFFSDHLLRLFGADEGLLYLAQQYLLPIKFTVPLFLFNQMLAAFLRNDNNPGLATAAVLCGGVFNIFGDYYFVFSLDMGILGAGIATAIGASITFLLLLLHFFSKKNTLRLVRPEAPVSLLREISVTGFSTFFIDAAMGILTMLFNRQIMNYFGAEALAVYGVIVNISTVVQCCAYSAGQAAQPIISINYGAEKWQRIRQTLRYGLYTVAFFGSIWLGLILLFPNELLQIFMAPTPEVAAIAPFILRSYGLSFLLLPFNIFSTYYFQAVMHPKAAFFVSVVRGIVLSGLLIYFLPLVFGAELLWFAMPITELIIAGCVFLLIRQSIKAPNVMLSSIDN